MTDESRGALEYWNFNTFRSVDTCWPSRYCARLHFDLPIQLESVRKLLGSQQACDLDSKGTMI